MGQNPQPNTKHHHKLQDRVLLTSIFLLRYCFYICTRLPIYCTSYHSCYCNQYIRSTYNKCCVKCSGIFRRKCCLGNSPSNNSNNSSNIFIGCSSDVCPSISN